MKNTTKDITVMIYLIFVQLYEAQNADNATTFGI